MGCRVWLLYKKENDPLETALTSTSPFLYICSKEKRRFDNAIIMAQSRKAILCVNKVRSKPRMRDNKIGDYYYYCTKVE